MRVVPFVTIAVSSANWKILVFLSVMKVGMSATNMLNRSGETGDLCGSLSSAAFVVDVTPSIRTAKVLSCSQEFRIRMIHCGQLCLDSLWRRPALHTLSYAFSMSSKATATKLLGALAVSRWLVKFAACCIADVAERNPSWHGGSTFCSSTNFPKCYLMTVSINFVMPLSKLMGRRLLSILESLLAFGIGMMMACFHLLGICR